MFGIRVLPALAWTLVIAWLSSGSWGSAQTGDFLLPLLQRLLPWAVPEQLDVLHWLIRKTAHVVEYAVLASLWRWAATTRDTLRGVAVPLGLSVLTAVLDEVHQATTLTRTGSPIDVLLDSASAMACLLVFHAGARAAVRWLTGALLWVAAAGGTALLALNWGAGAPSGWLWVSVAAAWITLAAWLRRRRPE
jgi:VanZ family protein